MRNRKPEDLLIIDIETVAVSPDLLSLDPGWQKCWADKVSRFISDEWTAESLYPKRAAVMAEFAKIICISCGLLEKDHFRKLYIRSFSGEDEKLLLSEFILFLRQMENRGRIFCFAGHNIKEFDIPFICRRLIANELMIPRQLDFQDMKPWETNLVDTFQYWRFGDYKHFTSLELLTRLLNIPSPKEDIDGSQIHTIFWNSRDEAERLKNMVRITRYCENDIIATANLILRFKGLPGLHEDDIVRRNILPETYFET